MRKLRVHSEQRWKSGKPIGAYDLLIAGQARAQTHIYHLIPAVKPWPKFPWNELTSTAEW